MPTFVGLDGKVTCPNHGRNQLSNCADCRPVKKQAYLTRKGALRAGIELTWTRGQELSHQLKRLHWDNHPAQRCQALQYKCYRPVAKVCEGILLKFFGSRCLRCSRSVTSKTLILHHRYDAFAGRYICDRKYPYDTKP